MKENKFIRIEEREDKVYNGRTSYEVINKRGDYVLGEIYYLPAWRQYVFAPFEDTEYNYSCLETIVSWLTELNQKSRRRG